jgi:hypothetical protein
MAIFHLVITNGPTAGGKVDTSFLTKAKEEPVKKTDPGAPQPRG